MASTPSNIRVFVEWDEPTVFAGEFLQAKITFKNVAAPPSSINGGRQPPSQANGIASGSGRQRKTVSKSIPAHSARNSINAGPASAGLRGHRPALSLNLPPPGTSRSAVQTPVTTRRVGVSTPQGRHGRSVSIISLGGSEAGPPRGDEKPRPEGVRRFERSHVRSTSLQVVPRKSALNGIPPVISPRSVTQPPPPSGNPFSSPLISEPQSANEYPFPQRHLRRASGATAGSSTPGLSRQSRRPSGSVPQNFRFPQAPPQPRSPAPDLRSPLEPLNSPAARPQPAQTARILEENGHIPEHLSPAAKLISASSLNGGTPRSSGEFYSLSNNSSETLASEYSQQATNRSVAPRPIHFRRPSGLAPSLNKNAPENLMMGYAQVSGSFVLDGSLVNQSPFEEVKRRGVVGGQGGGGVVGVEKNRRGGNGLFGGFGWSNLGESIGGLLGGGELSSIREMRGIASSKTIPILTTPQSILFIDLRLLPGQSKSFSYKFPLPTGLPPSHRGKAIKISYSLIIGTQRPATGKSQQQVKHVEVPFRVYSGVNPHGELLGHDLMIPHTLLKDVSTTTSLPDTPSEGVGPLEKSSTSVAAQDASENFADYVRDLLAHPRQNSSAGLLSPPEGRLDRQPSFIELPSTVKEAIDLAILRSNVSQDSRGTANRFNIARGGRQVATLILPRPAFRLGETINAIIDFSDSQTPCYEIHAMLETSEKVDPTISLRSEASIQRVTRRIHASRSECTLFAQRISFSPTIPLNGTPDFITSGIDLAWKIRVEFVTPKYNSDDDLQPYGVADELMEEISQDERGAFFAAVEHLKCESFEVTVPLKVYGAPSFGVGGGSKDDAISTEGLAI